MNALESASLVMIPSGYEDGTLGSLKPTDGSGDFTFSRGSNLSATRIGEDGYIEKGYENLLLQSNTFDTTWRSNGITLTGGQVGYDGTNNAWLAEKSNPSVRVEQTISGSGVTTFSAYLKAGSLNFAILNIQGASQYYDLENGVLGSTSGIGSIRVDFGMESVGDGWYRCYAVTNQSYSIVRIYPARANNDNSGTSGNIYIQDAMLNQGLVAYPYLETTTAPVAGGILEDTPRLDWSGSCPSLLLEPSRTNEVSSSEYISGSNTNTIFTFMNSVTEYGQSPEGLQNAALISAYQSYGHIRYVVTTEKTYTASVFVKSAGQLFYPRFRTSDNLYDLQYEITADNTISLDSTNLPSGDYGYDEYNDGWYRIWAKLYVNPSQNIQYWPDNSNNISQSYVYGFQIEQDATYPTSYIPTYGSSATRLGDVTDRGANLSYTGDYTFFAEFKLTEIDVYFLGANTSSVYNFMIRSDDTLIQFGRTIGTSASVVFTNTTDWESLIGTTIKMAFYKSGTTFKLFINGTPINPTTNTLSTGNEVLDWRYINVSSVANRQEQVYIKQLLEFQTALSDDECIELTTI